MKGLVIYILLCQPKSIVLLIKWPISTEISVMVRETYLRLYVHKGSDIPATRPETDKASQSPHGRDGNHFS